MKFNLQKQENNSTFWINVLGVIACLSVFMLHADHRFLTLDVNDPIWIHSNIIQALCCFGVPCFFMMSGATLIGFRERYTTKQYFIKRIRRCLIPYLIWSVFVLIGCIIIKRPDGPNIPILIFNVFFLGRELNYWFFPILFLLYLLIAIVGNVTNEKNRINVCFWIIVVGFSTTFLTPFILNLCNNPVNWPYSFDNLIYPLVYACCGYLIRNLKLPKWLDVIIFVVALGGLLTQILGTYFWSIRDGNINSAFKSYCGIPCFFYSLGIILFVKKISYHLSKNDVIIKIFNFGSQFTFSIYLLHSLLLMGATQLYSNVFHISSESHLYVWTVGLLVLPFIVLVVWLLRKIPYVNRAMKYVFP